MNPCGTNRRGREGYSLVEVTLALLVVGIGLLAVFGLFPEGLKASRSAVDAVEVVEFAEFVFESFELRASNTNDWADFDTGTLVPAHPIFDGEELPITVGVSTPQLFIWYPDYYGQFDTSFVRVHTTARFTFLLDVGAASAYDGDIKYVWLKVWPGDRRSPLLAGQNVPGGVTFYREYAAQVTKGLPNP